MSKTTFQIVASEFAAAFESRVTNHETTRGKFPRIWTLKEGSPDWMRDAMHDAHTDGRLPDDWIYENCRGMLQSIEGCEDAESVDSCEIVDSQVDNYTSALCEWLAQSDLNAAACDEAISEGLAEESADMCERMQLGQYILLDRACAALVAAIETQADERDAAAPEVADIDPGTFESETP